MNKKNATQYEMVCANVLILFIFAAFLGFKKALFYLVLTIATTLLLILLSLLFVLFYKLFNFIKNNRLNELFKNENKLIKKWERLSNENKKKYIVSYPQKIKRLNISEKLIKEIIKTNPEKILELDLENKEELIKYALKIKPSLIKKIKNPTKDMKLIVIKEGCACYLDNLDGLDIDIKDVLNTNEEYLKFVDLSKEELISYIKEKPYAIAYVDLKKYFKNLNEIQKIFKDINIKKYMLKKQLKNFK